MKKSAIILTILSVGLFSAAAFAEDQNMEGMDMPQGEDAQQGGGMMGKKGGMMKGMMGGMHQQPTMTVTPDGGVLVLSGNKLAKYDAQLNLINEVELKGGPSHDKMKWKEMPREGSGPQPMNDAEVAAILEEAS